MKEKIWLTCKRCGRPFLSSHYNTLYCNMPSIYPEDKGRTCQEMRRVETKRQSLEKSAEAKRELMNGLIVVSDRYGYLQRSEWMNYFYKYLRNKYKIGESYAEMQAWTAENGELVGEEYDKFQKECGLKSQI